MVKLSDRKIRWIVRHCYIEGDVSTKEAARIHGVSVRRIQQIIKTVARNSIQTEAVNLNFRSI